MSDQREKILSYLQNVEQLPSLPDTTVQLLAIMSNPQAGVDQTVKLIRKDPGLATYVLKAANAAFFSPRQPINSIERAVAHLGLGNLKRLVLANGVISAFPAHVGEYELRTFWRRCLSTAFVAEALVRNIKGTKVGGLTALNSADSFSAGLVHDVGSMILLMGFPKLYRDVVSEAHLNGVTTFVTEYARLGISHMEAGEFLCRKWGLPEEIIAVTRYHHEPEKYVGPHLAFVQLVHLADFICINRGIADGGESNPVQFSLDAWSNLGLSIESIPDVIHSAEAAAKAADSFL